MFNVVRSHFLVLLVLIVRFDFQIYILRNMLELCRIYFVVLLLMLFFIYF